MAFDFENTLGEYDNDTPLAIELHKFTATIEYDWESYHHIKNPDKVNQVLREVYSKWKLVKTKVNPIRVSGSLMSPLYSLCYSGLTFEKELEAVMYGDMMTELQHRLFNAWVGLSESLPEIDKDFVPTSIIIDHEGDNLDKLIVSDMSKRIVKGVKQVIYKNLNIDVLEYDGLKFTSEIILDNCYINEMLVHPGTSLYELKFNDNCVVNNLKTITTR